MAHSTVMDMYYKLDEMSHAPSKNTVRKWIDNLSGGDISKHLQRNSMYREEHGMHAVRQYGEAIGLGALLALVQAETKDGLDIAGKYPLDGGIAVIGLLTKLFASNTVVNGVSIADDGGNVGSNAACIMTYRKFQAFLQAKRNSVAGETDVGGEPSSIEQLARNIDR